MYVAFKLHGSVDLVVAAFWFRMHMALGDGKAPSALVSELRVVGIRNRLFDVGVQVSDF